MSETPPDAKVEDLQNGGDETELEHGTHTAVARLMDKWHSLSELEKVEIFRGLSQDDSEDFFLGLTAREHAILMKHFSRAERRLWIRFLAPDDAADLLQNLGDVASAADASDLKAALLDMVDQSAKREIVALLSYREDEAGGLMSTRYVRVRPDMEVAQAIRYVRQQVQVVEPAHYIYVLDSEQKLLGVLSLRQLFIAAADKSISEIMETKLVTIPEEMDQEQLSQVFTQYRYFALPVVDADNRMRGIVTVDDALDVSREEATEDIQKLGGVAALESPYPQTPFGQMILKRGGWLSVLFVGEMFTASAMAFFFFEIEKAVALTAFVPLIISSGGNSGSQASSLIIRALALKELRLTDWWRVFVKEFGIGLTLGAALGTMGVIRVVLWPYIFGPTPGFEKVGALGITVGVSLICVVMYGSLVGSMLPFLLRSLKLDPATASAPLVATLVDVVGLVIYFTIASQVFFR